MRRRSAPRPIAASIEALAACLAPETLLAEIQAAWSEAVGPAVAGNAQPTAERDGLVTVSCSAAVWAQELDLLAPQLVPRINAALGRPAVSKLRCRAGGFTAATEGSSPNADAGARPLSGGPVR